MDTLQKITFDYNPTEDRVRMTGLLPDGATVNIWLTQRLLALVVKELLVWLDKRSSIDASGQMRLENIKEIMQEFAQQAALSSKKPEVPVVAASDAGLLLPSGFDYSFNERVFTITFRANVNIPDSEAYRISLEEVAARQWLHGLRSMYVRAGWRMDIWPEWLSAVSPSTSEERSVVKH